MTISRELVKQTLELQKPKRIPRQIWTLPWAQENHPEEFARITSTYPDDIEWAPQLLRQPLETKGDPYAVGTYIDEWGCEWENKQRGVVGEVKNPLVQTWDDLDKVSVPEHILSVDVEQVNAYCRETDKFTLSITYTRPFERLQYLRGSENVFMDLALRPPEVFDLLETIHQFFVKDMEIWAKTDVDALFFQDDWGAQNNLLISPKTWREVFKPLYKEYVNIAHSHGKYAFMHSDGNIEQIYPDLIEIGLDAINSQLFCMDIENLGQKYAGAITFWGEIDRQNILAFGTTTQVDEAVRRVKKALYREGGVIAQCSFAVGDVPSNVEQVFKSWKALS
jgi:uroporphyrinogen-III decarboxylase